MVEIGITEQPKELAIAWLCPDLKGFPLRVESHTSEKIFVREFNKVKLEEPHEWLFKVPDGFTKCQDLSEVRRMADDKQTGKAPR